MNMHGHHFSQVAHSFHDLYYNSNVWRDTFWHDTPVLKCPLDLWMYQELLVNIRPELIVECGTWAGGSAFFMAHMLDLIGKGEIITIDVLSGTEVRAHYDQHQPVRSLRVRPEHQRITYLLGSSTDPPIVRAVAEKARGRKVVLVVADSDHSEAHAACELEVYHSIVTPGSYFIMEDTNIGGSGPRSAVEKFLMKHADFEVDRRCEKLLLTFNPGGYLRRKVMQES
jgi:cephalosporin hydroxylase